MNKSYFVYLLNNTSNNRTYLGITNNLKRRLRQHNGEISGGAKYTSNFKGTGEWQYFLNISNLSKSEALSIERTAKNRRKGAKGITPTQKRVNILNEIIPLYSECKLNLNKEQIQINLIKKNG